MKLICTASSPLTSPKFPHYLPEIETIKQTRPRQYGNRFHTTYQRLKPLQCLIFIDCLCMFPHYLPEIETLFSVSDFTLWFGFHTTYQRLKLLPSNSIFAVVCGRFHTTYQRLKLINSPAPYLSPAWFPHYLPEIETINLQGKNAK